MSEVKVFRYRSWDHAAGEYVIGKHMATQEAIDGSDGLERIDDGALVVRSNMVDGDGFTREAPPE